jgi:hypothetical protein
MILAEFARQLDGARRVRLATEADTFPDGFVETAAGTLNVEVTEVDKEKRRWGDEYKAGVAAGESDDDWEERAKKIPGELERVLQKKGGKRYRPKPTLVVYLNLGFGVPEEKILSIPQARNLGDPPAVHGARLRRARASAVSLTDPPQRPNCRWFCLLLQD